jgi:amino acid transporter
MDAQTAGQAADAPPKFTRSLSGFGVIVLTLSVLSPGVSIFVSGGTIIQEAGSAAIAAFLLGTLINYCQTSMAAELGSAYPTAGYDYAAVGYAIGDWAGGTTYIAGLFLLIEVVALLLVAGLGVLHVQPGVQELIFHPMASQNGAWVGVGLGALALASTNASWSIAGSSQALLFCEDMKRPATVGRIMMICFALTAFLETAPVIGTIIGSHDLRTVLAQDAPFEAFLAQYLPDFGMKLVSLSIAVAIFNASLAGFIGMGRNLFAMGRTQLFTPALNHALMRLTPKSDAPWFSLLLLGITTALATLLSMKIKIMLLSGGLISITVFYVWGSFSGRRSGRTGTHAYRMPLYPLIPVLGIFLLIGEIAALWVDRDIGRPSLFIWVGINAFSYSYYRFVLMRRPEGWRMEGPRDIDAQALRARAA